MTPNTSFEKSWQHIINLSGNLLLHAEQGSWDNVENLSGERHEQIVRHFQSFPIAAENALINQQRMVEFTKIEGELNRAIENEKKRLGLESALIKKQRLATKAYGF